MRRRKGQPRLCRRFSRRAVRRPHRGLSSAISLSPQGGKNPPDVTGLGARSPSQAWPQAGVARPPRLSVQAARRKLPAPRSQGPNGRQEHLFLARVPARPRWGKDHSGRGSPGGRHSRRHPGGGPRPAPRRGPRARPPPRGLTCGAEPQAGPERPSRHARRRESCRGPGAETRAAAVGTAGKGSWPRARGREAWRGGRGRGRAGGRRYPPRTPPASASGHARNCGACAELRRLRSRDVNLCAPRCPRERGNRARGRLPVGPEPVRSWGRFREARCPLSLEGNGRETPPPWGLDAARFVFTCCSCAAAIKFVERGGC